MFRELVKTILSYEKNKSVLSLKWIDTLKKDIREDVIAAFELSESLIERHPDLYRSSTSYLDFLFKYCDVPMTTAISNTTNTLNTIRSPCQNCEQLENKIQEQEEECNQTIKKLEGDKNRLSHELSESQTKILELTENISTLKVQIEDLNKQINQTKNECNTTYVPGGLFVHPQPHSNDSNQSNLYSIESKKSPTEDTLNIIEITNSKDNLSIEYNVEKSKHEKEIETLQLEKDTLEKEKENLKKGKLKLEEEKENIVKKYDDFKSETVSQLEDLYEKIKNDIQQHFSFVDIPLITSSDTTIKDKITKILDLNKKINMALENKINAVEKNVRETNNTLNGFESNLKQIFNNEPLNREGIETAVRKMQMDNKSLSAQCESLKQQSTKEENGNKIDPIVLPPSDFSQDNIKMQSFIQENDPPTNQTAQIIEETNSTTPLFIEYNKNKIETDEKLRVLQEEKDELQSKNIILQKTKENLQEEKNRIVNEYREYKSDVNSKLDELYTDIQNNIQQQFPSRDKHLYSVSDATYKDKMLKILDLTKKTNDFLKNKINTSENQSRETTETLQRFESNLKNVFNNKSLSREEIVKSAEKLQQDYKILESQNELLTLKSHEVNKKEKAPLDVSSSSVSYPFIQDTRLFANFHQPHMPLPVTSSTTEGIPSSSITVEEIEDDENLKKHIQDLETEVRTLKTNLQKEKNAYDFALKYLKNTTKVEGDFAEIYSKIQNVFEEWVKYNEELKKIEIEINDSPLTVTNIVEKIKLFKNDIEERLKADYQKELDYMKGRFHLQITEKDNTIQTLQDQINRGGNVNTPSTLENQPNDSRIYELEIETLRNELQTKISSYEDAINKLKSQNLKSENELKFLMNQSHEKQKNELDMVTQNLETVKKDTLDNLLLVYNLLEKHGIQLTEQQNVTLTLDEHFERLKGILDNNLSKITKLQNDNRILSERNQSLEEENNQCSVNDDNDNTKEDLINDGTEQYKNAIRFQKHFKTQNKKLGKLISSLLIKLNRHEEIQQDLTILSEQYNTYTKALTKLQDDIEKSFTNNCEKLNTENTNLKEKLQNCQSRYEVVRIKYEKLMQKEQTGFSKRLSAKSMGRHLVKKSLKTLRKKQYRRNIDETDETFEEHEIDGKPSKRKRKFEDVKELKEQLIGIQNRSPYIATGDTNLTLMKNLFYQLYQAYFAQKYKITANKITIDIQYLLGNLKDLQKDIQEWYSKKERDLVSILWLYIQNDLQNITDGKIPADLPQAKDEYLTLCMEKTNNYLKKLISTDTDEME